MATWSLRIASASIAIFLLYSTGSLSRLPRPIAFATLCLAAAGFVVALGAGVCGAALALANTRRGVGIAVLAILLSVAFLVLAALLIGHAARFGLFGF